MSHFELVEHVEHVEQGEREDITKKEVFIYIFINIYRYTCRGCSTCSTCSTSYF